MAYKISDDCIACGTCAGVCPVSAISEGDGKYVIDADACLDWGTVRARLAFSLFRRFRPLHPRGA